MCRIIRYLQDVTIGKGKCVGEGFNSNVQVGSTGWRLPWFANLNCRELSECKLIKKALARNLDDTVSKTFYVYMKRVSIMVMVIVLVTVSNRVNRYRKRFCDSGVRWSKLIALCNFVQEIARLFNKKVQNVITKIQEIINVNENTLYHKKLKLHCLQRC